jgi:hypothetical protein
VASYASYSAWRKGVAVEGDLGVECVDLAGRLEDQRVDLGQVGVALGVGGVELQQDVDRAVGGGRVERGRLDPGPGRGLVEPVDRVDPDLGDGVGVLSATASISTPPSADSMPRWASWPPGRA